MAGFAMDRSSADAALRYEPQGAFLVRMCPEPGCYAISCRTSNDSQSVDQAASADGFASSGMSSLSEASSCWVTLSRTVAFWVMSV